MQITALSNYFPNIENHSILGGMAYGATALIANLAVTRMFDSRWFDQLALLASLPKESFLPNIIHMSFTGPILEELTFRGLGTYVATTYFPGYSSFIQFGVLPTLFALQHVTALDKSQIPVFLRAFVMSQFFQTIYTASSIWGVFAAHLTHNIPLAASAIYLRSRLTKTATS